MVIPGQERSTAACALLGGRRRLPPQPHRPQQHAVYCRWPSVAMMIFFILSLSPSFPLTSQPTYHHHHCRTGHCSTSRSLITNQGDLLIRRKMYTCFAIILLRIAGAAVESFPFQPAHRRNILMFRVPRHPVALATTTLHATNENEALKAELSEYLRKRDEVNADAAAKT